MSSRIMVTNSTVRLCLQISSPGRRSFQTIVPRYESSEIMDLDALISDISESRNSEGASSRVIGALLELRNSGSRLIVDQGALGVKLASLATISLSEPVPVRISAAILIANQLNRGFWPPDSYLMSTMTALLSASVPHLPGAHGVYLARAFRAVSVLSGTSEREMLIESLLQEADRKERIISFSAMDISEICHSAIRIRRNNEPGSSSIPQLDSFVNRLLSELLDRQHNLRIQLTRRSRRDDQWLSIQAVSNILYSTCTIVSEPDLGRQIAGLMMDLCSRQAEREAVASCQAIHLISIIQSTLTLSAEILPHELRCFKKLLDELSRKRDHVGDLVAVNQLLESVQTRWRACAPPVGSFIVSVKNSFAQ